MAKKAEAKTTKTAKTAPAEAKTASKAKRPAGKQAAAAGRLTVTLVKSTIGFDRKQGLVVESLGLRRPHHTIQVADTPAVRGMLHKVRHLVEVK